MNADGLGVNVQATGNMSSRVGRTTTGHGSVDVSVGGKSSLLAQSTSNNMRTIRL